MEIILIILVLWLAWLTWRALKNAHNIKYGFHGILAATPKIVNRLAALEQNKPLSLIEKEAFLKLPIEEQRKRLAEQKEKLTKQLNKHKYGEKK